MSTNSHQDIILVTGVSGFIASHVAVDLLRRGLRVRGTARHAKLQVLRASNLTKLYPNLELVQVEDVASSDLTEVLKGVGSVVHIASPLAGKASAEVIIDSAISGTMNVLRQAQDAGVKDFVVTSSIATVYKDPNGLDVFSGITFSEKVFSEGVEEISREEVLKFGREHPGIKIATINPPFIYGPTATGFPPTTGQASLGTNGTVYTLLTGKLPPVGSPLFCDVRDAAKAHVAALLAVQADTIKPNEPQRFLVCGGSFHWKDAVEYLVQDAGVPDEVKRRLPSREELDKAVPFPGPISTVDTSLAKEVLGFESYIDWKTSVKDTILSLSEEEKVWLG
ncbi:hypothetical protein D9757_003795 [Collybiopsis confluens]|uniref:NAD-dependent epimerase/dehydratase domain-containing protein n=1 Tax=Collybiopsis confluens TaxID=2823264 RepID=A0A8H5MDJ8_9AGAR|nr:hypothetical protein D9757_003795 [Collybiopsis confluens]